MKRVSDLNHPFYRPLWRRVLLVAVTGAWATYENFVVKDPMWMVLTAGIFVYAAWVFLIKWVDPADKPAEITGPVADEPSVTSESNEGVDRR
ncbi:hypothetical protein CXZ10_16940 [Pleomorphomonas diazotrophica]|uniref:DUF3329 domain-containing protein n=1 Tax=Pleomorphomonas diazotrophica TaxID=1166257 RepID=A0A1I4RPV3_9HYPH|nr:hypothetical protein [Pleomorphomonas diazotrophica]PKR88135.1 hypothetical protein CXZ10_16940 [Pleomorphomonas diazotrophica]SFM54179.1 hypothetical protein SAMN05192571_102155 [Pleomorphomonas diazotrophica]